MPKSASRGVVLGMIRREIMQKRKWIRSHKDWEKGDRFSAAHWAYGECLKVIRRHGCVVKRPDGKWRTLT
jgi:hypothetical protein